jgi:hypothetical protein
LFDAGEVLVFFVDVEGMGDLGDLEQLGRRWRYAFEMMRGDVRELGVLGEGATHVFINSVEIITVINISENGD